MIRNSKELAELSQEWAAKAKKEVSNILKMFMDTNNISFDTLCEITPIYPDVLEDILNGESDMISMNELAAIMLLTDLVVEIMPSSQSPLKIGSGTEEENIVLEAKKIEGDLEEEESFGCGIIMSDNPRLKEAMEVLVNMFDKNPQAIDSFIKLYK